MMRPRPQITANTRRYGSINFEAVLAIGCLFLVVVASAGFVLFKSNASSVSVTALGTPHPTTAKPKSAVSSSSALVNETKTSSATTVEATDSVPVDTVGKQQPDQGIVKLDVVPATGTEDTTAQELTYQTPEELLGAHLEAGEFGPALALARTLQDSQRRADMLRQIADAQLHSGEFNSALMAIRAMPGDDTSRQQACRQHSQQHAFAGGGAGQDFDSLIDLIMNETSGPWQAIDGTGGTATPYATGVRVDPNGLFTHLQREEQNGRLDALGVNAREADLNDELAKPSSLRLVSLTRLEREISRRLAAGQPIVESMQYFAGLSKIQYVFVYPNDGEIVIGGPAEPWRYNETGLPVGVSSGRPMLQLDDFVTANRIFDPSGQGIFICAIVPREEGLRAVNQFSAESQARGPLHPGQVNQWARTIENKLGLQDIEYTGIPANSRVARVIVDADYRMKLIGIGKLDGGPQMKSFFDLLTPEQKQQQMETDALRWWLTMKYDAILHSSNRDVFEIQGSSVLCRSENELITAQGKRIHTGKAEPTNRLFAQQFTSNYDELAKRDLVFADLQNIFDLSLLAALIHKERLNDRANWDLGAFAANGRYLPAAYEPAKIVHSVVNHKVYAGGNIILQAAGGVKADLKAVVNDRQIMQESPRLGSFSSHAKAPELPAGRWWWDAATR